MALEKVFSLDQVRKLRPKLYMAHTIDLSTARNQEVFHFTGNNLLVVDASDLEAEASVRFNEMFFDDIPLRIGRRIEIPFYRYFITHAAQAGKTITLAAAMETEGQGLIFNIRDDVIPWVGVRTPGAEVGSYGQVSVTTTATQILAANGNRRSAVIQNLDATNDLFIGFDNSVTTANAGHKLIPDAAIEIYFTGTIFGIRSVGSGNAAYLEESNA